MAAQLGEPFGLGPATELIAAGDLLEDDRVITGGPVTIEAAFTAEATAPDAAAG